MQTLKKIPFISLIMDFIVSCAPEEPKSLINSKHLGHLYQKCIWPADSSNIGTVWIYCDAPNYNLLADPIEGFTVSAQ